MKVFFLYVRWFLLTVYAIIQLLALKYSGRYKSLTINMADNKYVTSLNEIFRIIYSKQIHYLHKNWGSDGIRSIHIWMVLKWIISHKINICHNWQSPTPEWEFYDQTGIGNKGIIDKLKGNIQNFPSCFLTALCRLRMTARALQQ